MAAYSYFSNGGGAGSARHNTEKPASRCPFLRKQNLSADQSPAEPIYQTHLQTNHSTTASLPQKGGQGCTKRQTAGSRPRLCPPAVSPRPLELP